MRWLSLPTLAAILLTVACSDDDTDASSTTNSTTMTSGGGGDGGSGGANNTGGSAGGGNAGGSGGSGGSGASTPTGTPVAVAVGYGTRRVRSLDATDWTDFQEVTASGGDDADLLRGLCWGDGVFVAVGGGGGGQLAMRSLDGVTWSDERRTNDSFLGNCAYVNGVFVAAGGNGTLLRSTDMGATWIDDGASFGGHYRDMAGGNSVAVAVGHGYGSNDGVGLIATTTDGVTWTQTLLMSGPVFGSVAFGNGAFVAVGDTAEVLSSTDAVDWANQTLTGSLRGVVFANGEFLIHANNVGAESGYHRSSDGTTWTFTASADSRDVAGFVAGQYISMSWPAQFRISADLMTWQTTFNPMGSGFTRIVTGYLPDN